MEVYATNSEGLALIQEEMKGLLLLVLLLLLLLLLLTAIGLSPGGSTPTLVQTKIKINRTTTKHQNNTKQLHDNKDKYTNRTQKM